MPARNNPKLGDLTCSVCGGESTVHQSARGKGRWLYTRGCECKFRQGSGKTFQTDIWNRTKWLPDAQPIKPPNVAEVPDFDPNAPVVPVVADPAPARPKLRLVASKPTPQKPPRAPFGWLLLAAVAAGVVAAILTGRSAAP